MQPLDATGSPSTLVIRGVAIFRLIPSFVHLRCDAALSLFRASSDLLCIQDVCIPRSMLDFDFSACYAGIIGQHGSSWSIDLRRHGCPLSQKGNVYGIVWDSHRTRNEENRMTMGLSV